MPRLTLLLAFLSVTLLTGCGERGDKAIAYGKGLGADWTPTASGQMRIAAENFFTRDVIVQADAPGVHYELTIGPIRQRYMILPEAKYEISAFTRSREVGNVKLYVEPDNGSGFTGLRVKIRP